MKKAAEYFVIFLMIQFISLTLVNGTIILKGGQLGDNPAGAAIGMNIATFIMVIAVFVIWLRSIKFSFQYYERKPYLQLLLCTLLGFSTISPSVFIDEIMPSVPNVNKELFNSLLASPMGFVSLVFIAPISEEIVFRGAILNAFNTKTNKWLAIFISALLFALVHFNPAQILHAFIMGLMLGWVYFETKSVVPCMLIHIINNGTAFIIIKYYAEISVTTIPVLIISAVILIMSLWGIYKVSTLK